MISRYSKGHTASIGSLSLGSIPVTNLIIDDLLVITWFDSFD